LLSARKIRKTFKISEIFKIDDQKKQNFPRLWGQRHSPTPSHARDTPILNLNKELTSAFFMKMLKKDV
jgi:hypothetical protein